MLTRGAQVTGVAVCGLCLTWVSVSLRFYVRLGLQKFIGREDWLTLAAMILFTLMCSLMLRATNFGLGAHWSAIPSDMLEDGLKFIFICELLYVATTAVAKLSIGVYFLRLSNQRYQFRVIYTTLGVVILFSTMYFWFLVFQCTPISFTWAQFYSNASGKCLKRATLAKLTYAHAVISAVTDSAFGILPVFFVWKLKMSLRTKISVVLILSLGFFASTANIVRIVYIYELEHTTDYSWFGINLAKWSIVEPAIRITAAAIATLRPLFANFLSFETHRSPLESKMPFAGSTRFSGDSHKVSGSGSALEYSAEFAEMLGLKKFGNRTHISAQKPLGWRERRRFAAAYRIRQRDCESQTELREVESHVPESDGIRTTTEVIIEKE
ncbi:hypothetical protein BJ878DRAFT_461411 [Calycina marina]|uniref:Rhodopsin domain-containing protein n=1 Tax=Calycina marina TaxID=1763456 RepID=A0A9P7Z2U0_9HELO|nr:hypothetical protein BJ878DRAFT_461411 [Calycina marina]